MQIAHGSPPVVYEDGKQLRDYVGISDVVSANLAPLDVPAMAGQSFNVGGDRSLTVTELAELVAAVLGHRPDIVPSGLFRLGATRHIRSNVARLRGHGWSVRADLRAVVKSYVRWAVEAPDFHNAAEAAQQRMRAAGVVRATSSRSR